MIGNTTRTDFDIAKDKANRIILYGFAFCLVLLLPTSPFFATFIRALHRLKVAISTKFLQN